MNDKHSTGEQTDSKKADRLNDEEGDGDGYNNCGVVERLWQKTGQKIGQKTGLWTDEQTKDRSRRLCGNAAAPRRRMSSRGQARSKYGWASAQGANAIALHSDDDEELMKKATR
ncbi:hypothetical protein MMC07_001748 [Pseudocyphellaria aurata]|nr:hypothetical protein [Pseudocyphellaria aurata]